MKEKIRQITWKTSAMIKAHYIIAGIIAVLIIIAGVAFARNGGGVERILVGKGTITETVQASGKTKPAEDVNLGFDKGGRVRKVNVKVGDTVRAYQTLVMLEQGEQYANLLKAEADLAAEISKLGELRQTNSDAKINLIAKIKDAYTKSDDAVRNYSDQFFTGVPLSIGFKNSFSSSGTVVYFNIKPELQLSLVAKRNLIENVLSLWPGTLLKLSTGSDLEKYIAEAKQNLATIASFLEELSTAVNNFTVPGNEFASTFSGFRNDVSTARSNINTANANLIAAEEKYNLAKIGIGESSQSISAQENKVESSRANVKVIEAGLAQMSIRAPFDGLITKSNVSEGEIVTAGEAVISLVSQKNYEIESNISEVNIGKVRIGNPVKITLDAFPREEFMGTVSYVEPAETIVDNVVTYKVTITLDRENKELKSGLTANLNIETAKKDDVVVIPQFAVKVRGGKTYVMKLEDGTATEEKVELGARGSDGMVEILSGLSPGDVIEVPK